MFRFSLVLVGVAVVFGAVAFVLSAGFLHDLAAIVASIAAMILALVAFLGVARWIAPEDGASGPLGRDEVWRESDDRRPGSGRRAA